MIFLVEAMKIFVAKAVANFEAGFCVTENFDLRGADLQTGFGFQILPIEAGKRQVFAGCAGRDGMALALEFFDEFERKQTHGARGAAVKAGVALFVAFDAAKIQAGAGNAHFGDAAVGIDIDSNDFGFGFGHFRLQVWDTAPIFAKMEAMFPLALALAFLCGAIPFGVLIGKMRGVDVRAGGSGNIGATNVWRLLGPKAGTAAFVLDVSKGLAGPFLARNFVGVDAHWEIALCAIAAVLGHTFSPFLGFKGGKGIATSLGAMLGMMAPVGIGLLLVWGVVLALSRMVSVASVAGCVALPILALVFRVPMPYFAVGFLMSVVALVKHIPNLKRVLAGTEPKIGAAKKVVSPSK